METDSSYSEEEDADYGDFEAAFQHPAVPIGGAQNLVDKQDISPILLSTSERAGRSFKLQYNCVADKYERKFDCFESEQPESRNGWQSMCSGHSKIFRKVENDHRMVYLSRQPREQNGWICWRIAHKGLKIESVKMRLAGMTTFKDNAHIWATLSHGSYGKDAKGERIVIGEQVHSVEVTPDRNGGPGKSGTGHLLLTGIGPADFTELRVHFDGGVRDDGGPNGLYNEWQHSQLFRTSLHVRNKDQLSLRINFADAEEDDEEQKPAVEPPSQRGDESTSSAAAKKHFDANSIAVHLANMFNKLNSNPTAQDGGNGGNNGGQQQDEADSGVLSEGKRKPIHWLRALCEHTQKQRRAIARALERQHGGMELCGLLESALPERADLVHALFPPHYEDHCIVGLSVIRIRFEKQPKTNGDAGQQRPSLFEMCSLGDRLEWCCEEFRPRVRELPFQVRCKNPPPTGLFVECFIAGAPTSEGAQPQFQLVHRYRTRISADGKLTCPSLDASDDNTTFFKQCTDWHIQLRVLEPRANFTEFSSASGHALPVTGVLNVEGMRLHVNRELLNLISPFFSKLFTQQFAECGQQEVNLRGLRAADVEDFLLLVGARLGAKLVLPNPHNLPALLELAEYFDVPFLAQQCADCLVHFREVPLVQRMRLAHRYRLDSAKSQIINLLDEQTALSVLRSLKPEFATSADKMERLMDGLLQGKSPKVVLAELLQ